MQKSIRDFTGTKIEANQLGTLLARILGQVNGRELTNIGMSKDKQSITLVFYVAGKRFSKKMPFKVHFEFYRT